MKKRHYYNLDNVQNTTTWQDLRQWRKERKSKIKDLTYQVPLATKIERDYLSNNRQSASLTWIGHATFFIQMAGLNLLIDPVWANRMGFDSRLSAPGIPIRDLPEIDLVLISHNHYDHLHFGSIRKLKGTPQYFIPAGLAKTFLRNGYHRMVEFEWWETKRIGNVSITFVPAQHWSKRTPFDTDTSHWGGWILQTRDQDNKEVTIYYAGDTGYFRGFKEIGERFQIEYALMPIGAYEPEWFMSKQHVTPEEAIQGYLDCKGKYFIPMHYGAFRLADDTPKEALDRLFAEWELRNIERECLLTLARGETLKL